LLNYVKQVDEVKFDIVHFINNIFYSTLQLQKMRRERYYNVIIIFDLYVEKLLNIYKLIAETIFDYPIINSIKIIPKNILPIFASGGSSGIIIEVGHLFTTITPVHNGYPYQEQVEVLSISTSDQLRHLKNFILEDNRESKTKIKAPNQFTNSLITHLNDLYVRSAICVTKQISNNLIENKTEQRALQSDYCKIDCYSDIPEFQVIENLITDLLNE
jgi:actin-related protein